jgi:hypothetical protein
MLGVVDVVIEMQMPLTLTRSLIEFCFDYHPTTIDRTSP